MKTLAGALALAVATMTATTPARAEQPPPWMPAAPPPWMPAPAPPPPRRSMGTEERIRKLRHEAALFGAVGIGLFAAGIAVDVVALDVPQGEQATRNSDGSTTVTHYRNDANWAELAIGSALLVSGFALVIAGIFELRQARRLASE
jgi:hypothetical protein